MVPVLSAPATSNGAANQAAGLTSTVLPDSSLATAVNFTCWPTSASTMVGVTSTVFTVAGCCPANAAVAIRTITPMTMSFMRTSGSLELVKVVGFYAQSGTGAITPD